MASGGGSVTGSSATTNSAGIAMVGSWTLGASAGANTLTATSGTLSGSPVNFTATGSSTNWTVSLPLSLSSNYVATILITSDSGSSISKSFSFDTLSAFAANVRNWMPQAPADGAEPLGFNFEGPYINTEKMGAQNPAFIQVPAEADRRRLEDLLDGLRFITMAPEVPGALDLIRWFAAHGVVISLGHSNTSYAIAAAAYAAGARSTTHIFNAMSGVHQHEPGLAVAALADNGAYVEMIADGHHVDRSVWPLVWRAKRPDRLIFVSDAISMAGAGQGRFSLGGLDVEIVGDECRLVSDGHLAGSVIAIDTAVRNMVQAGLSLSRAVAAATQNPLALLGVTDRGRLAPDQRADLVELDADLRVHRVMRAGRWYEGPAA